MAVLHARLRPAAVGVLGVVAAVATLAACTSSSGGKGGASGSGTAVAPSASASVSLPVATSTPGSGTPTSSSGSTTASSASTAPSSGINVTVPPRRVVTNKPIPLRSTATIVTSVTARIVSAQSVRTQAHGPGEVSGPGVKLTIELTNGTNRSIGLDQTVVNVSDQDNNPASPITSNATPFQGTVAPHRSAKGVYEFTLPSAHTTRVNVELSYSASAPTVVFSGPIS